MFLRRAIRWLWRWITAPKYDEVSEGWVKDYDRKTSDG